MEKKRVEQKFEHACDCIMELVLIDQME